MNNNFKVVNQVYETTDYGAFNLMTGNRDIRHDIIRILKDDISTHGQLNPIVVNENLDVIDGQFRLTAMSQLGIPIKFIVQEGLNISHVRGANAINNAWNLEDHLKSRVSLGDERYVKIEELINRYQLNLTIVLMVCAGKIVESSNRKTSVTYAFKRDFPIINKDWNDVEKECELIYEYKQYMEKPFTRKSVQSAILSTIRKENYIHERMMEQLSLHYNKIELKGYYASDVKLYLNDVYNYRKFKQNVVSLLSERELLQAARNKR